MIKELFNMKKRSKVTTAILFFFYEMKLILLSRIEKQSNKN